MKKTSSEIQDIFCLSRDDIRTLERDHVLNPIKNGQGRASYFGLTDLDKLLNIKLYLLAGYKVADMKDIMASDYDLDVEIEKQIYLYGKRIKMLEFIRNMRADFLRLVKLSQSQIEKINIASAEAVNMSSYGSDYYYACWSLLKLLFIFDFLTREKSISSNKKYVQRLISNAYHIIKEVLGAYVNTDDFKDINDLFLWMAGATDEDDKDVQEFLKEVVKEVASKKEQLSDELMQNNIKKITVELDSQSRDAYSSMMMHSNQFILDYFFDDKALYYLYLNIKHFVIACLDKTALEKGKIIIGGIK